MIVDVEVTQEDIASGKRYNSCQCPIAMATKRAVGPGIDAYVGLGFADLWKASKLVKIRLPESANKFVDAFDSGKPVEPATFPLDIPDHFLCETPETN